MNKILKFVLLIQTLSALAATCSIARPDAEKTFRGEIDLLRMYVEVVEFLSPSRFLVRSYPPLAFLNS